MIDLSYDFVVTAKNGRWAVEQFYYIHPGGPEYDPETDSVRHVEPQCGFRPVYEFEAETEGEAREIASGWLDTVRERVISAIFLNEHPDGGYFTGGWDRQAGQWIRPLDPEIRRLTGCHSEFSRRPFSGLPYEEAVTDAYERYGRETIDRKLMEHITTNEAAEIFSVPLSSITLACRDGSIAYAAKGGRDWSFPTVTFLVWLDSRPGRGRRRVQCRVIHSAAGSQSRPD